MLSICEVENMNKDNKIIVYNDSQYKGQLQDVFCQQIKSP